MRAATLARAVTVAAVLGLAVVPSPAGAQSAEDEIQILNVADGADGTVSLEVAIPPSIGQLAPVAANFGVTENGQLREATVAPLTSTVDVMLVLDTSGSMRGQALAAAREAAAGFVRQLAPEARVGVVSFSETAQLHTPPSSDHSAALAAIDALAADGETALWEALVLAADTVAGLGAERPYVVVLADGASSAGSATQEQAVARLGEAGARLYAIALETADTDRASLDSTVATVGGQFFSTADVGQLQGLYTDIANRLSSRYQLTFDTQPAADRTVIVSVAAGEAVATTSTELAAAAPVGAGPDPVLNTPERPALGAVAAADPGILGAGWLRLVGVATLFGAFVILALLMAAPASQVRLDAAAGADQVAGLNTRLSDATGRFVARRDTEGEIDGALDAAGINLRAGEFVLVSVVGIAVVALGFSVVWGPILGLVVALVGIGAVLTYLHLRTSRRRRRFSDQLTDALTIMGGGLRAGRGLPQALELVAEEAAPPLSEQFRRVVFETRVGRDMTASLLAASKRMKSQDLEWVTRAVDINRELGGDLTEVLDNVGETIRDRRRVTRQVRALSAEGRATGWVLLALPVIMFIFISWRNPDFIELLTTTRVGVILLITAVVNMVVGWLWIRKLVNIQY